MPPPFGAWPFGGAISFGNTHTVVLSGLKFWIDMSSSVTYPNGGMSAAAMLALTGTTPANATPNTVLLTAENGTGALVGGIDATSTPARFGTRTNATRYGKKKEATRTNLQRYSRIPQNWANAGNLVTSVTQVTGADGGANKGTRYNLANGGNSKYEVITVPKPGVHTQSWWAQATGGTTTLNAVNTEIIVWDQRQNGVTTGVWQRNTNSLFQSSGSSGTALFALAALDKNGTALGIGIDSAVDFAQLEASTNYASSAMETGTVAGTRAADLDTDASIARWTTANNALNFGVYLVPAADFIAWDNIDIPLLQSAAGDYLKIQAGTGVLIAKVGGVVASIGALPDPWKKDDLVYMQINTGGGLPLSAWYMRQPFGGSWGPALSMGVSNNSMGGWSGSGALHILDDGVNCGFMGEVCGFGAFFS